MLLLPANLKNLTKAAATDNPRYAMATVRLVDQGERKYLAEATDGRILVRVEGESADPDGFPSPAALAAAPNSGSDTLVTSEDWARAFAQIPKPRKRGPAPVLATAAVIGEKVTTFGAVNAGTVAVTEAQRPEGRYPATNDVFPTSPPVAVIALDPELLSKVLDLAAEIATDDGGRRITLEVRDSSTALVVRAKTLEHSQKFVGLVMPLSLDKKEAASFPDLPKEIKDLRQTLDRMRESRDMHAEECKRMEEHYANDREQREAAAKNYVDAVNELASMRADLDTARRGAADLADQLAACKRDLQTAADEIADAVEERDAYKIAAEAALATCKSVSMLTAS